MSTEQPTPVAEHGSHLRTYSIGFVLSVLLTGAAFFLVSQHGLSHTFILDAVVVLALIQLFVQLIFFLHLNREQGPRWNLITFTFMAGILLIVVIGSLWIMDNLNYNMMSPEQIDKTISNDEGIGL